MNFIIYLVSFYYYYFLFFIFCRVILLDTKQRTPVVYAQIVCVNKFILTRQKQMATTEVDLSGELDAVSPVTPSSSKR